MTSHDQSFGRFVALLATFFTFFSTFFLLSFLNPLYGYVIPRGFHMSPMRKPQWDLRVPYDIPRASCSTPVLSSPLWFQVIFIFIFTARNTEA